MLQNFTACFLKPSQTIPRTYSPEFTLDVWFVGVSASSIQRGKVTGVTYEYECVAELPYQYRAMITEDWGISIDGIQYAIKDVRPITTPEGYHHTVFGCSKRG